MPCECNGECDTSNIIDLDMELRALMTLKDIVRNDDE